MVILLDNSKGEVPVQAMKAYGGVDIQLHPFLTLLIDGGEWSDSHLGTWSLVPTELEAGWASEPLWTRQKSVPAADQTTILQLPAHSLFTTYTNYAVPSPWTTNAFSLSV
jgi:hypothetical protein